MAPYMSRKALIYCRAQGSSQNVQSSLMEQVERCRVHARENEYQVVGIFRDEASGKASGRPALNEMLAVMRADKVASHVIITDDISRLSRSLDAYLSIRRTIAELGGTLEMPLEACVVSGDMA